MTATKSQLIDFICKTFVDDKGEHPTKSQLDVFKKEELAQVVLKAGADKELDSYVNSLV